MSNAMPRSRDLVLPDRSVMIRGHRAGLAGGWCCWVQSRLLLVGEPIRFLDAAIGSCSSRIDFLSSDGPGIRTIVVR